MSAGPAAVLRRAFPALLLAAALAGCGVLEPSGPMDRLRQARERWEASGIRDYRLTVGRLCFCLEQAATRVIVEVRNGAVASRTYLDSGAVVEPQWTALYPGVPGLFRVIEDAIRNGSQLEVRYHSALGYPQSIEIDEDLRPVDGGVSYAVSAFQTLGP
jgi:hypothetical protein